MKPFFLRLLTLCSLFFILPAYAADTYTIDSSHTYVQWYINHFGFSNPSGKWMVAKGTLVLDEKKPQNSKVDVTIQMDEIDTGIIKLDEHLKGGEFFNVEQFPVATFISDKVILKGKDKALVRGILTMHGVSKPVTLDVKLNKLGYNPVINKMAVGFSATTLIKRSDFDMKSYLPGLGDDVKIVIEAEAVKSNS